MLYDFEQAEHVAAWGGLADEQTGSRNLSLEAPEVTAGDKALKIVFTGTGSDWPGIATSRVPADWSSHEALKFEVWSVNPLSLSVRIDDEKSTDHASRFNFSIKLEQKKTLVQIPVESIQRSINAANIKLVCIYLTKPPAGTTLFIDNIRLGDLEPEQVAYMPPEKRKDAPYTDAVKTPVAWQVKPLPGGALKVFAIPSISYGRELVELAQRIDMTYGVVTWDRNWDQNTWGMGDHYGQRGHRFDFKDVQNYLSMELAGPNQYDVYVIRTPVGWKWFPKTAREALLQRVKDGAGLVLVQPFVGDETFDASDLWSISALVNCKTDTMEEPGGHMQVPTEGLIAGQSWKAADPEHYIVKDLPMDLLPFKAMSYQQYEAAPEAAVLVQSEQNDPIVAVRPFGKGRVVTLAYRAYDMTPQIDQPGGSPPPVDYAYWEIEYALVARCVLWAAGREAPVNLPEEFLRQARAQKENPIQIQLRETVEAGTPLNVAAMFTRDRYDWSFESYELQDTHNRIIERIETNRSSVTLPTERVSTFAAKVIVTAADRKGNRISKVAPVVLRPPTAAWNDYEVIMWPNDRLPWQRPLLYEQMRQWGCTATLDPQWSNQQLMRERLLNGLRIVPHGVRRQMLQQNPDAFAKQKQQYELTKDKKHLERFMNISDPRTRETERATLWSIMAHLSQVRPLAYCIGEEDSITSYRAELDLCFAPATLKKFGAFLQEKYGEDLDALNARWGTEFKSWGTVMPMTSDEAKAHGNFAPWAEHRTFMDNEWADINLFYRRILERTDNPKILMGTSGTQVPTPHDGQDWYKLMPAFNWLSSYTYGHQDEMHIDFAEGKPYITAATGYGISADRARYQLWTRLFHGNAGAIVFWWIAIQNPDLSLCKAGQDLGAVMGEIKSGVGRLVFEADRQHDPIAVHYSIPSMQAGWITTGDMKAYETALDAWWVALQELGYQPVFVSSQQIEQGRLEKDGFKALVMPRSVAISAKEKEQIDAFAKAGNAILGSKCDVGMYDADLAKHEVAMVPQGYQALDPIARLDAIAAALAKVEVLPPIKIESRDGSSLKGLEIVRYNLDGMQLIGILRPPAGQKEVVGPDGVIRYEPDPSTGKPVEPVRITFPINPFSSILPGAVNVRTHERLKIDRLLAAADAGLPTSAIGTAPALDPQKTAQGMPASQTVSSSKSLDIDLPSGDATLLAIIYPNEHLKLAVPAKAEQGGKMEMEVSTGTTDRRVIRVEVRQPDGSNAPWLTRNLLVKGSDKITAAIALDDKIGEWTVTAADVVTGAKAAAKFTVNKAPATSPASSRK
jgi:hypothetical protein